MLVVVKLFINCRRLQPEVGGEVKDFHAVLQQRHGKFRRDTVRQCQKRDIGGNLAGIRFDERGGHLPPEAREDIAHRFAGILP